MSTTTLAELKDFLNVTHSNDDTTLQALLDGAENRALRFMNRTTFAELDETDSVWDSTDQTIPDTVKVAVWFYVQSTYDAPAEKIELFEKAAERMMMPYRIQMGI